MVRLFNFEFPRVNEVLLLIAVFILSITFNVNEHPTVNATGDSTEVAVTQSQEILESFETPDKTPSSSVPTTAKTATASAASSTTVAAPVSAAKPFFQVSIAGSGWLPVYPVGVDGNNRIITPDTTIGWWNSPSNAKPGEIGAIFLNGHTPGVLSFLSGVGVGSQITISIDGTNYNYRVVSTETYDVNDPNLMRTSLTPRGGAKGLNIMTCAGIYNPSIGTYSHRLVVFAVQI